MAIRATVSVATLRASISITTENSLSASIPVIQASIYAELLEAGVHYISNNATGIWTDADSKNRFLYEEMVVSDVQVNLVNKVLKDIAQFTDDETLDVNKRLFDTPKFTEVRVAVVGKYLTDTTNLTDDKAVLFAKTLVSTSATQDAHAHHVGKSAGEHITDITDSETKAFGKDLLDYYSVSDNIYKLDVFKQLKDTADFVDDETIDFAKSLFDIVGVTDDIDGAASILDDQEMDFFKHTTDIANITDLFTRVVTFVRVYSDLMGVTDSSVWDVTKALADTSVFTDIQRQDFGKLLIDTPVVSDALAIRMMLAPFVDGTVISDNATTNAGKNFTHEASLADTGSLRSQGYSDFSYFAEDYVGASRTF